MSSSDSLANDGYKVDAYNKQDNLPSKLNMSKGLRGSQRLLVAVVVEYNKTYDINKFSHTHAGCRHQLDS